MFTVAYKRTAVLSGTLDSNHSSSLAVDGVTLCPQNSILVAVSNWSPVPWLMIQLDTTYYIAKSCLLRRGWCLWWDIRYSFLGFFPSNVCALYKTNAIYWTLSLHCEKRMLMLYKIYLVTSEELIPYKISRSIRRRFQYFFFKLRTV